MDTKRRRVLVVDASPVWRRDLARGLSRHDISVSLAATLREGKHVAQRDEVDAIVLDVIFPDGHAVRVNEFETGLRRNYWRGSSVATGGLIQALVGGAG